MNDTDTATLTTQHVADRIAFCEAKAEEALGEPVERYWRTMAHRARGMLDGPTVVRVDVEHDTYGWHVSPVWDAPGGLDRPNTGGIVVTLRKDAERLAAAMRDGAVYYEPEVVTDVNGATFVSARTRVIGKYLHACLRDIGY